MPETKNFHIDQDLIEISQDYQQSILDVRHASKEFYGTPPNFFKAVSYQRLIKNPVLKNDDINDLDDFRKYNKLRLKDLTKKFLLLDSYLKLSKIANSNELIKQTQSKMDSLRKGFEEIKRLDKFTDKTPDYDPIGFHNQHNKKIASFSDLAESVSDDVFTSMRETKDKHYAQMPHGTKKEYYKKFPASHTAKWISIELAAELVFGFITTFISFQFSANPYDWQAMIKGLLIGVVIGLPFEILGHGLYHYAQNRSRNEFGKDLGDEISTSLHNKIYKLIESKNLKVSKQEKIAIEEKIVDITNTIMEELYWETSKVIAEDIFFHYIFQRPKKMEFGQIKHAPYETIATLVGDKIMENINFEHHIKGNTVKDAVFSEDLKNSIVSDIRGILFSTQAVEKSKHDIDEIKAKKRLKGGSFLDSILNKEQSSSSKQNSR